tara:strand:- start:1031 stop:2080 length:1050 start_codon:yes stop_codon:yes gene_type:complete
MKFFLTALLRAFRKEMGRSPTPGEMDMLKKKAKEMEQSDKIIPFPPGGKDKVSPFKERPKVTRKELQEKIIGKEGTIQDMKEAMEPDGIMDVLLGKEKKITRDADKLKPKITETEAEMLLRMNRQNKEAVERLKKKKEKDLADKLKDFDGDPDALASGGVVALAEGGPSDPSKRKFMKILGGLASIPILGRFITPVKQVAEVAPAAVEAVKGVPSYFFKLADKIRRLGEDAPGLTSVEREFGKKFKNYEMVENTDGEIVIKKNTTGNAVIGDDVVEGIKSEEVMVYKPKKRTEDGILNEDYQEITVRPDGEGKLKDVEDGLDTIEDIMQEVGESRIKQAGGGIAYLLGE